MGRCRLDFVGGELVGCDKWGAVKGGILFWYGKESQPSVTSVCSSAVLPFYCLLFCSADTAVGLLV